MTQNSEISTDSNHAKMLGDSIAFGMVFALLLTIIQRCVGFGRGILFCRLMPEDQLGQWSLIYSFVLLLAPLAMLGLPGSFCRYLEHYRQQGKLGSFLYRVSRVSFGAAVAFAVLMFVWPEPFGWLIFRESNIEVVRLMAVAILATVIFFYLTSLLEALCQVRLVTMMRFTMAISFAVVSLGLVVIWKNAVVAVTVGYTISNLIGSLPGLWFAIKYRAELFSDRSQLQVDANVHGVSGVWRKVVPFAAWLWLTNFVTNVYELADRSMLLHFSRSSGQEAQALVGQYHSGRVLPLVLVGIAVVIGGFLMPFLTRRWENSEYKTAREQLRWAAKMVGFGFTAAGLAMLVFAPLMFETFLGGRYADGYAVLPITLVYCIWYSILVIVIDYLWVMEKGKFAVLIVSVGLLVNIVINFFTIPAFGLYGAVFATALSNLITLVLLLKFNQRLGLPVDTGTWLVIAIPLVLLMPVPLAILAFALVGFASFRFQWVLDAEEKKILQQHISSAWQKLRNRKTASA